MSDPADSADRRPQARALVEKALQAERAGDQDEADRLFAEAERIDPDETAEVLQEHRDDRPPRQ
ncbi:MAG: hypothetical protein JSS43_08850 [Proteobacteria bacterium]|nr:hypothetical protein [Pseudomonadota bacterium]